MADAKTLDELNIPQDYRDRAKMLWIITLIAGLWGWVICNWIWKIEGQENNEWFQFQLKQAMFVGIIGWVGSAIMGLGWIVMVIFSIMGIIAIGGGKDFEAPGIAGIAKK